MGTERRIFVAAIATAVLAVAACGEAPTAPPVADVDPDFSVAKAEILETLQRQAGTDRYADGPQLTHGPANITYEGELGTGAIAGTGNTVLNAIFDSNDWDYWSFCAVAGSTISIDVHRTTSVMDAGGQIYSGVTDTSNGLVFFGPGTNPDVTFLVAADDNNGIPHGVGGPFADPRVTVASAPVTGVYTLAVFDVLGDGPGPQPYEIHTVSGVVSCVITVDIDIKPGSDPNSINTKSKGNIPVAILGSATFDVNDIDRTTLAFGPDGATPTHKAGGHVEDVNDDGFDDLVSHYATQETGLASGDTEACVTGETIGGDAFEGCDAVNIVK